MNMQDQEITHAMIYGRRLTAVGQPSMAELERKRQQEITEAEMLRPGSPTLSIHALLACPEVQQEAAWRAKCSQFPDD